MKLSSMLAGRFLLLIPMAYCLYLLLVSQEMNIRLVAIIALIVLEQARQWMMVSSMKSLAKGNKP